MKLISKALLFTVAVVAAIAARAEDRLFAVVDYMHLPEQRNAEDYIALEKLWLRLHQKAVDTGLCRGWYLNRVENGGRSEYVTVRVYDSLDKAVNPWPESLRSGLYNSDEMAKIRQGGQIRQLIHSEVWELEASAMKQGETDSTLPMHIQFMKPNLGKASEYYHMEHYLYKKIHQARIDAGQMKTWLFLSRTYPHGTDSEYDFVTVDVYPSSGSSWDNKVAQSALSKEEWEKLPPPWEVRTLVREEIWHPLLRTTPAKKQ